MGVIKLSGWTHCTTLNCDHGSNKTLRVNILYDTELWIGEFYYSHIHSSVSYNMFTLRVLLLPWSQFSVVQHIVRHWTVNMGVIQLSGWTYCTTLNCEHGSNKTLRVNILYDTELFSVVQCVHLESFITPIFTVQCRIICSPWEFYYSHENSQDEHIVRHWTVNMGVIKLSRWTHCTTLNCEYGSNKTL
jgi:hypothetical protein